MRQTLIKPQDLYAPIAENLPAVQRLFDEELLCDLPFIDELCAHIRRYRGKMLRPALVLLSAKACGRITPPHTTIAAVLEMVHMATLLHDDVLDGADRRRNVTTINAMKNNETAVLLGDYLISHAYHLCSSLDSQFAARTIASCTNTVCEGELLQVYQRNNWNLTEADYMTIISRKTASLTSVACMLGAKFAGSDATDISALESYGMDIGVAFQIVDDILDLIGNAELMGKTLGLDLGKGKLTLPIIHFLHSAPEDERQLLKQFLEDPAGGSCRPLHLWLADGIAYAEQCARRRAQTARNSLERIPPSDAKDALVNIADFIVDRDN